MFNKLNLNHILQISNRQHCGLIFFFLKKNFNEFLLIPSYTTQILK